MLLIHHEKMRDFIQDKLSEFEVKHIIDFLENQQTFVFPTLENGLFPAANVNDNTNYTGYANVWVRDNIYLAYSYYMVGRFEVAVKNVSILLAYFKKYQWRFEGIIDGRIDPNKLMERPHIRFNGRELAEINQEWNQAQNDALGYFLWFYCKLVQEKLLELRPDNLEILALFPFYFKAISYWEDEDSGHWEEDKKIEASSIGVVIAGLKELKNLLMRNAELASHCKYRNSLVTVEFLNELINIGIISLENILPSECIQPFSQQRRYDAALLFLIYPLQIVDEEIADTILKDVIDNLQGDHGIRRYLGDSFWCRDYKDIPEEIRTTISSEREQWFKDNNRELKIGEEAQWCIFDPIVSAIFGIKFQKTHQQKYLERQTYYLNRSLGQLTSKDCEFGEFKCPELYYLQHGSYVPGDATPLLWTQANLRVALKMMELSLTQIDS